MRIVKPILLFFGIVVLAILVYRIGSGPILETLQGKVRMGGHGD